MKNTINFFGIAILLFFCVAIGIGTAQSIVNTPKSNINKDVNIEGLSTQQLTCDADSEKARTCTACLKASVTYSNIDCSTYTEEIEDSNCTDFCPKCTEGEEVSRVCTGCKLAQVTYTNADCTEVTKKVNDSSCTSACPLVTTAPQPAPQPAAPAFTCNCNKTCDQMISCQEAYFQLNQCGCRKRDGDNDGIPCESIC